MTRKVCCVFLTLSVLIFIGAGCRDSKMATDAKVVFINTLKGNFFFQLEVKLPMIRWRQIQPGNISL